MTFPRGIFPGALGALLAVGVLYLVGWIRPGGDAPRYRDVHVDSSAIVRGEPDAEVGLVESIARPRIEPVQRATAPDAAAGDVAAFCRAAGYSRLPAEASIGVGAVKAADTASAPRASLTRDAGALPGLALPAPSEIRRPASELSTPHSGLPPALQLSPVALGARSGVVGRRESEFWIPLSDGSLVRETYDVRPPYRWRVDGDSLVLQRPRLPWLRDLVPVLLCAGGAWGSIETDSWVPAAIGCGLGVAITVR